MSAPAPRSASSHPRRGRPPTPGLRAKILSAAESVFARHDYHEVQMDDIVEASGVGKGTLYRYFSSKQHLFFAVMFEGIEHLRTDLEGAVQADDPPALNIRRIVHRTLTHFWDRRFFFSLIHRNEHKPDREAREWYRHREALSQIIQRTLADAIGAGHVRQVNVRVATEILLGMMRGVNRYRVADDQLEDVVGTVVEVFMCGVGTPTGRRMMGVHEE